MPRIKFYQGTVRRSREAEEYRREYFTFGPDKILMVGVQEPLQYPAEYEAFQVAVKAGNAPQVDDSGDLVVVEPRQENPEALKEVEVKEGAKKNGLFSKKEKK